jgi:hypothetical protein
MLNGHQARKKRGKDSLLDPEKNDENKKKEYSQLCTIDTIFLLLLFYLLALLVNDRFTSLLFFSLSLLLYVSNMCKKNKNKEEERIKREEKDFFRS